MSLLKLSSSALSPAVSVLSEPVWRLPRYVRKAPCACAMYLHGRRHGRGSRVWLGRRLHERMLNNAGDRGL